MKTRREVEGHQRVRRSEEAPSAGRGRRGVDRGWLPCGGEWRSGLLVLAAVVCSLLGLGASSAALASSTGSSGGAGGDKGAPASATASGVVVNGSALSQATIAQFAQRYGLHIPDGRYWYDPACGAWGIEGGPALGLTVAGANFGAPLRPDASGGGNGMVTGVFFNGRELHPYDVAALSQLGPVYPGRYWIDAYGNAGFEGGPALVNLWQLARQAGGGGKSYQRSTAGGYIGGDGSTSYFFDPETGSSVMVGN